MTAVMFGLRYGFIWLFSKLNVQSEEHDDQTFGF
jgi:hypothetical protein